MNDHGSKGREGDDMKTTIIVLGMHRSGTSVLSELLHRWGAHAGDPGKLLAGDEWNPQGYWEFVPLIEFNDALLASVDASWIAPPADATVLRGRAALPEWRDRALQLLATMRECGGVWFWKDPRLASTLPFWREIWGEVAYIIPIRSPLDIARSIQRRDHFPISASLLLWQFSIHSILGFTEGHPARLFVEYETLLQQPAEQCRRVIDFLEQHCGRPPAGSRTEAGAGAVAGTVNPRLRSQKSGVTFAEYADATAEQKELYAFVRKKADNPEEPFEPDRYPLWPGWRDYLATLNEVVRLQPYLKLPDRIRELRKSRSFRIGRAITKPFRLLFPGTSAK